MLRRTTRAVATAGGSDVTVTVDGIRYLVDHTDGGPGGELFVWRVLPEFAAVRRALALLDERGESTAGRVFVDVGANIGTTCLPAVAHLGFARAIAIEPYRPNAQLLRANANLNELAELVDVVEAAASDYEGEATFAAGKPTTRRRHRAGAGTLRSDGAGEAVRVVTVDDELTRQGVAADDVGLLWADVMGHEARVALGARKLLDASRPFVFAARTGKLRRTGDLQSFTALIERNYAHVVDLRDPSSSVEPSSALRDLLRPRVITDVLAFGRPSQRTSA